MGTIGYNSTTNLGAEQRLTTSPHFIFNAYGTYTPSVTQTLTKAGYWVPGVPDFPAGQLEIGVFRVSDKAKIASAIVSGGNPSVNTAYEANLSGTLTAGVAYCVGWRVVADAAVMRYDTGATTGDRNSGLTGTTALQNPFVTTGEGLTSIWGIYAITADAATGATISTPTSSSITATTATLGCTTNQASGNLYYIASINQSKITGVTATQLKLGQGSDGVTLGRKGNAAVSTTTPTIAGTGFTAGALYYYALVQNNGNGDSNIVTGTFTTAPTGPSISGLSASPSYQGSITISGAGFPTSQTGSAAVTIGGVAQTVTWNTASSCSIASIARGTAKYGTSINIVLTDASGNVSPNYATTLSPQAGWNYVTTSGTLATTGDRITASPDIVSGDQIAYGNIQGTGTVTMYEDASFTWDQGVTAFDIEINDGTGFSAVVTQYTTVHVNTGGIRKSMSSSPTRAITSNPT